MSRGFAATGRFSGVGLGGADVQAYDLAPPFGVAGHGGYGRDGDDAPALALAQVGGVQISITSVDVIDTRPRGAADRRRPQRRGGLLPPPLSRSGSPGSRPGTALAGFDLTS
jgi:hypothetical protein